MSKNMIYNCLIILLQIIILCFKYTTYKFIINNNNTYNIIIKLMISKTFYFNKNKILYVIKNNIYNLNSSDMDFSLYSQNIMYVYTIFFVIKRRGKKKKDATEILNA